MFFILKYTKIKLLLLELIDFDNITKDTAADKISNINDIISVLQKGSYTKEIISGLKDINKDLGSKYNLCSKCGNELITIYDKNKCHNITQCPLCNYIE